MSLPTDPTFYIVAALAVALVGVAKGGFAGLGAASMPMLVLVMDPIRAAAMLLPILIAQDVVSVWAFRRSFDLPTLKLMVPGAVFGILLGWIMAASVPVWVVEAMVGLISVVFGANRLIERFGHAVRLRGPLPSWFGTFWGGVSGFTSQVAHAGGPPFQVWALTRNFTPQVYIGTSSIFFAIVNWLKVPAFFALGQFTWANMKLTLVFMPVAILSTLAGVWLVKRISPDKFNLIINVLMVAIGLKLLQTAFS